jgi:hypothetical protein
VNLHAEGRQDVGVAQDVALVRTLADGEHVVVLERVVTVLIVIRGDTSSTETIVDDARLGKNTREGRGQRQPSASRLGVAGWRGRGTGHPT